MHPGLANSEITWPLLLDNTFFKKNIFNNIIIFEVNTKWIASLQSAVD